MKIKNKKGQVTIFVIIAILIVVSVALVFMLRKPSGEVLSPAQNPAGYMEKCMRDSLERTLAEIEPAGGVLNADKKQFFNGTDVAVICYTGEYEKLCVNYHPMLSKEIEKQIKELMMPEVEECLSIVKNNLARYNYQEESNSFDLAIEISPEKVSVNVAKRMSYLKNEQRIEISGFASSVMSPLFQFSRIANRILNEELRCDCGIESCNADLPKITLDNPEFIVEKATDQDDVEIYSITEILSEKKFNFAIRNCVRRPLGYTGGF